MRQIDFNDEVAIAYEIEQFINIYAYSDVEHALVVTPKGNVYNLRGNKEAVNPGIIIREELIGSIVVHNHPTEWEDSFSRQDFITFFEYGLLREDVVSGKLHNIMRYNGALITPDKARKLYNEAFHEVRQAAMRAQTPILLEQLETMRQLAKTMKGLIFNENT